MIFLHFIMAWLRVKWARVWGYEILADGFVAANRFRYCRRCKYFDGASCMKCHCLAQAKVMIAVEQCPKRYWLAIWKKKQRVVGP